MFEIIDYLNFIILFCFISNLILFFKKNRNLYIYISFAIISITCLIINGYLADLHIAKFNQFNILLILLNILTIILTLFLDN